MAREISSDDQAFLSAIITHPDDDLPRLVYADWLAEQGRTAEEELIRTQIARNDSIPSHDIKLSALEKNFGTSAFNGSHYYWKHPDLPDAVEVYSMRKGFIDSIDVSANTFSPEQLEVLASRHPLRRISLVKRRNDMSPADSEDVTRFMDALPKQVTHIEIYPTPAALGTLLTHPKLEQLTNLKILLMLPQRVSERLCAEAATSALRKIGACPYLKNLERLSFDLPGELLFLTPVQVDRITTSLLPSGMKKLTHLSIDPAVGESLAVQRESDPDALPNLQTINQETLSAIERQPPRRRGRGRG